MEASIYPFRIKRRANARFVASLVKVRFWLITAASCPMTTGWST